MTMARGQISQQRRCSLACKSKLQFNKSHRQEALELKIEMSLPDCLLKRFQITILSG
ncbi:unnamed protein product [Moneuplotes crassus]|uniref:Uncharacterized protein n=1 Tax=Euplotes crassus TaxID=5936 RepID=A0AAD1U3X1_EUPCR|nr:unnamed protein product [Moneuplotes crassus]